MGVKFISQQWALVPMRSPAITGSEDMARGLPAQPCWAGRVCLRGIRGGVSPQTHQMGIQRTPFTWWEIVPNRGEMLDAQGATTTAALNARKLLFQPH